ncbi:hypothetical protein [Saccharibacillus sacchari]|uniref:hypothetical protein n=1 Tax=Saccharibacillus sacchari TaxID=456493 RepID=UPI0004B1E5A3|nr:hypothetical protein [Saccharibacillus sacchari]
MVITNEAKLFIEEQMQKTGISSLRVLSNGKSCSCCGPGFMVKLGEAETNDRRCVVNGLEVVYEPHAISFVKSEVTLDLRVDEHGKGLVMQGQDHCAS